MDAVESQFERILNRGLSVDDSSVGNEEWIKDENNESVIETSRSLRDASQNRRHESRAEQIDAVIEIGDPETDEQELRPHDLMIGNAVMDRLKENNAVLYKSSLPKNTYSKTTSSDSILNGGGTKVYPLKEVVNNVSSFEMNAFEIYWQNLSYTVEMKNYLTCLGGQRRMKTIIKEMNGRIRSGQLTAIMGPSGAGKSTLLECVAGIRKKGLVGEVFIRGAHDIKISFIAQKDQLLQQLTVRESLMFASRLKNYSITPETLKMHQVDGIKVTVENFHQAIVDHLLYQLGLDVCKDTRVILCSGGQQKRLSIALELVSKPNVIILDEPTSGLDAASCYHTVKTLRDLTQYNQTKHPVAIAATIHQPSARVFQLFHRIYIISRDGRTIYQGSPNDLLTALQTVNLKCPKFHNPADYISEVASGDHGMEAINDLAALEKRAHHWERIRNVVQKKAFLIQLSSVTNKHSFPTFRHLGLLFSRSIKTTIRDPHLSILRLLTHVGIGIFIGQLYGPETGKPNGCMPDLNIDDMDDLLESQVSTEEEARDLMENACQIFFCGLIILFGGMMPTLLSFPMEAQVFRKERLNSWYSVSNYFIAKTLSEIPFQIIFPFLYVIITYTMTGQLFTWFRFNIYLLSMILIAFVGQSIGMVLSALFVDDPSSAVFLGPIITTPMFLFGGFFVRESKIPWYYIIFQRLSFYKYSFETSMITIYGFGRCPPLPDRKSFEEDPPQWLKFLKTMATTKIDNIYDDYDESGNLTDLALSSPKEPNGIDKFIDKLNDALNSSNPSLVMRQFEVEDDVIWENIIKLILAFVIMRYIAYFVLKRAVGRSERE